MLATFIFNFFPEHFKLKNKKLTIVVERHTHTGAKNLGN